MSSLFVRAKKTISLGEDIAALINTLRQQENISIRDLSDLLTGIGISESLDAALNESQKEILEQFFKRIRDKVDLDENLQSLILPISSLKTKSPLAWSFLTNVEPSIPQAGDLTISLSGSTDIAVRVLPSPSYSLSGQLGIAASLKLPFRFGAIDTNLKSRVRGNLLARFDHSPKDPLVIEALISDLPQLANLNRLSDLQDSSLDSATLNVTGEINIAASIQTGKTFLIEKKMNASTVSARAELGAKYGVKWAKSGKFQLDISKEDDGILMTVTQKHEHSIARTLSVGTEVSFTGIQEAMAPMMTRISQFPDSLEEAIRVYSKPGEILKSKFHQFLSAQDSEVELLAEAMSSNISPEQFVDDLIDAITDEFDSQANQFDLALEGKVDDLTDRIINRLPISDDELEDKIRTLLEEKTKKVVASTKRDLAQALKRLLNEPGEKIKEVLSEFGARTQDFTENLDASTERLLTPFTKAIRHYRQLEQKLIDTVEAIEKEKLAISFGRSVDKKDSQELLLSLLIKEVNDETQLLYQKMLTGDFSGAFQAGLDQNNLNVELRQSVFSRVFARAVTTGITINFFGLELGATKSITSNINITTEGGAINVMQGTGEVSSQKTWFGEKLSIKTSNLINFLDETTAPESVLSIHINYVDPDLTRQEIKEHLFAYEERKLITNGATTRAMNALSVEKAQGEITFTTIVGFNREEVKRIANNDEETIISTALLEQVESLFHYDWARQDLQDLEDLLGVNAASAIFHFRGKRGREIKHRLGGGAGIASRSVTRKMVIIKKLNNNCDDLVDYFQLWQILMNTSLPAISGDGTVNKADFEKLERLNQSMVDELDDWTQASGVIRNFKRADLSPWSLAFLMTLRSLSGRTAPLVPIVGWQENGREKQIAIV